MAVEDTQESTTSQGTNGTTPKILVGISIVVALGEFLFGYDTGVISGALPLITDAYHLSSWSSGLVTSSLLVGAMIGAFGSGRLTDRYGRRPILMGAAAVFVVGAAIAAVAPSAWVLIVARFVLGLAVGASSWLVPVFLAELATTNARGRLITLGPLLITVGIVVSYAVGYAFTPSGNWRAMFAVSIIPAALLFVSMFFLPESPRWLVMHGRAAEARRVLQRLRSGAGIEAEMQEIAGLQPEQRVRLGNLFRRSLILPLTAGIGLQVLGQASGVNTVVYYAPEIFKDTGFGSASSVLATVGVGVVNCLMTVVGLLVIDRIGRRTMLVIGSIMMAVGLLTLAAVLSIAGLSASTGVLAFVCVCVYIAGAAFGINIIVAVIPAEIYPLHIRGTALSITWFCNWGMNFVVSLTFLSLLEAMGTSATFWLYGGLCVILVLFTFGGGIVKSCGWRVPELITRRPSPVRGWWPRWAVRRALPS